MRLQRFQLIVRLAIVFLSGVSPALASTDDTPLFGADFSMGMRLTIEPPHQSIHYFGASAWRVFEGGEWSHLNSKTWTTAFSLGVNVQPTRAFKLELRADYTSSDTGDIGQRLWFVSLNPILVVPLSEQIRLQFTGIVGAGGHWVGFVQKPSIAVRPHNRPIRVLFGGGGAASLVYVAKPMLFEWRVGSAHMRAVDGLDPNPWFTRIELGFHFGFQI